MTSTANNCQDRALLPRSFYQRDTVVVARDLVGRTLVHRTAEGDIAGIIVEAEAYGPEDAANHAYRGETPRCRTMFGEAGHAYVYRTYGIHWCANAVTGPKGVGEAALIRALEPVTGIEIMRRNRGIEDVRRLCKGPGNLCAAMGITGALDGVDLTGDVFFITGEPSPGMEVIAGKRIGVTRSADLPWRFHMKGSPFVSR